MRARCGWPEGTLPEPGSIYELRYHATKPRVLGIGFAATRDIVSHLRNSATGRDLLGRQPTHALGVRHLAGRSLSARSPRAGLQSRRRRRARVRRRVHPCRRHRPRVLQHRVWPAGAHAHLARGPRLPRGGNSRFAHRRAAARRRQRSEGDRDQHLDRILAEGRVTAAHRSRRQPRRCAAGECARLLPAWHAAWRQGRHAARRRPMHQSAQLARSDAGDPRAAGGAGRMGGEWSRTAAIAAAAHRRRHAGARRGRGMAEACGAGAAACAERCGGAR